MQLKVSVNIKLWKKKVQDHLIVVFLLYIFIFLTLYSIPLVKLGIWTIVTEYCHPPSVPQTGKHIPIHGEFVFQFSVNSVLIFPLYTYHTELTYRANNVMEYHTKEAYPHVLRTGLRSVPRTSTCTTYWSKLHSR